VVETPSPTVTAPSLVSIAVTPTNFSLAKGLSRQFTATGTYTDASTADLTASVSWASSSSMIATINTAGLAQAAGSGTATISATLGTVVGSTSFTVTGPVLVSLAVMPANSSLAKGLNRQFTAIGTFSDGSTADLTVSSTFTSSVPTVAGINLIGMAHAVKPGTTTITATDGSVSGSTSLTVTTPDKPLTITSISAGSYKLDAIAGVTFTDADPNGTLAQYSATIAWGDHSMPSAAAVSKNPSGGFAAGGSHHYAKSGVYTITVTVKDVGGATASRSTSLKVS
jgi:Big-like domain-containing protein